MARTNSTSEDLNLQNQDLEIQVNRFCAERLSRAKKLRDSLRWETAIPEQPFDRCLDDQEFLRVIFDGIDKNKDGLVEKDEIEYAMHKADRDGEYESFMNNIASQLNAKVDARHFTFEEFLKAAENIPRVRGQRVEWSSKLGLDAALARYLKVGDILDPLSGIRAMTDEQVASACLHFFKHDLVRLVRAGRDELRAAAAAAAAAADPGHASAANSKFATLPEAHFEGIHRFYEGPEGLFAPPNPAVLDGMHREHCLRRNARRPFTSPNYRVRTCPADEWEFVVDPRPGRAYPHTPRDPAAWRGPAAGEWAGACGREPAPLDAFLGRPEARESGLRREEAVAVRLYTGPMFALYNAALRRAPADAYAALDGNGYETTLFCIASGVLRLARVARLPAGRRLWRGLRGLVPPPQFWGAGDGRGLRGGVEVGFMSTTADRDVALQYSAGGGGGGGGGAGGAGGTVFEIVAGRVDVGADVGWLSQYPGEREYLFPPLSCLEVRAGSERGPGACSSPSRRWALLLSGRDGDALPPVCTGSLRLLGPSLRRSESSLRRGGGGEALPGAGCGGLSPDSPGIPPPPPPSESVPQTHWRRGPDGPVTRLRVRVLSPESLAHGAGDRERHPGRRGAGGRPG